MVDWARVVGAVVGARHAGEDLGEPITARAANRAKATERFFVLEGAAAALFCGVELIDWTTVEVCVMVDDRRVCAKREHWHEAALHSQHAGEVPQRTPPTR